MVEIAEYKEWLATGVTQRGVIDTIEVYHPSWDQSVYLANWDHDIDCMVEDIEVPQTFTFLAARFGLAPSPVGETTEQTTSIVINSYDGQIYDHLMAMTPEDRLSYPILVAGRQYWTDDQSKQLVNPAPIWNMNMIDVSLDTVRGQLNAAPLRVHRIGLYYTSLEFPVLEFAR